MSEDFIKVALNEINEDIEKIKNMLDLCRNDSDIFLKIKEIEKPFHNLKGLAPMAKFDNVGEIAYLTDKLAKHIINNNQARVGSYQVFVKSIELMRDSLKNKNLPINEFKNLIQQINPNV